MQTSESSDPRQDDPREAENVDPTPDRRQTGSIEPGRPRAASVMENASPGDGIMEDDLTEERYPTPQEREDVAETETMDP